MLSRNVKISKLEFLKICSFQIYKISTNDFPVRDGNLRLKRGACGALMFFSEPISERRGGGNFTHKFYPQNTHKIESLEATQSPAGPKNCSFRAFQHDSLHFPSVWRALKHVYPQKMFTNFAHKNYPQNLPRFPP